MYVTGELAAYEWTTSDVIEFQMMYERDSGLTLTAPYLIVRVVDTLGTTFRGTLFNGAGQTALPTSMASRALVTGGGTVAVQNAVSQQATDRLVIEIGFQATSPDTNVRNCYIRIGDNSGTDLARGETETDDYCPWIEFTTAAGESGSGSDYESGSGSGYPEDHELVIADMILALTFGGVVLTQAQTLSVAGMTMALNLEALALTQNHQLTTADIAMALGFDAPVLTQAQLLAVDDVAMGAVYGEPTLAQDHTLAVEGMAHALNFGSPALVQASVLVVDDIVCALVFGTPTLMTGTILVVNDMALALTFDEPTVTQDHTLSVADMNIALILDAFGVTQAQTILVDDMTLDLLFDSITLPGTVVPVVPGAGTPCGTWASRDRCGLVGPKIRYLGKKCGLVGPKPKRCED